MGRKESKNPQTEDTIQEHLKENLENKRIQIEYQNTGKTI